MGRLNRSVIGATLVLALLAAACTPSSELPRTTEPPVITAEPFGCTAGAGVDGRLVPDCGVLLGTIDAPNGVVELSVADQQQTINGSQESAANQGREFSFELVRAYQRGSRGAVAALNARLADLDENPDRLLYFSWKVATGRGAWESIAAGSSDADLVAFATAVAEGGHTIFLSLHHEPEGDQEGVHYDYVEMWRHSHDLIETTLGQVDGGGDVVWVMNYMGHVSGEDLANVDAYYPGSEYVDWLSYNPYNWAECRDGAAWRSFLDVATPMYRHLTTESQFLDGSGQPKPILIGETATNEDPDDPQRKARWLRDMADVLAGGKLPMIKGVVYFNQAAPDFCDRYWSSSEASAAEFAEIALDPFFNPQSAETGGS